MRFFVSYFLIFIPMVLSSPMVAQMEINWYHEMNDMAFGNAALMDLDDDGNLEIAFSMYRNDGRLVVLNAEDGSLFWEYDTGGCNDSAPLIFDVDMDGSLEIILASSCNPTTFCFDGATGEVEWSTQTHGSDSPPSVADLDGDGIPEILYGAFGGWVTCLNGEDGSIKYDLSVDPDSWIQTAPAILDIGDDGQLDFVVSNWSFVEDHRIFAFNGKDASLLWETDIPEDYMYHGVSVGDLDNDGSTELVIGDYSGKLMVINAEDGSAQLEYRLENTYSIAAPTHLADMDNDGSLDIVFIDWYQVVVINHESELLWKFNIPDFASSFRGCAISDLDGNGTLDLVFATSDGKVYILDGNSGEMIDSYNLREHIGKEDFELQHGPVVADFDGDGKMDVFVAGGHAEYPEIQNNYGRAYALTTGKSGGPDWPMFRRDVRRNSCVCELPSGIVNKSEEDKLRLIYNSDRQLIHFEGVTEGRMDVSIYDISGKILRKISIENEDEISVKNLLAGIYFIQIIADSNYLETKILTKY